MRAHGRAGGGRPELGESYFHSDEAKAMVAAWGMHIDFGPDVAFGALFPFLESFADMDNGMSRALAAVARSASAEIRTVSPSRPPGISCHDREFRAGWLPHLGTKCRSASSGDEPCEASSEGEKATCIATTLM